MQLADKVLGLFLDEEDGVQRELRKTRGTVNAFLKDPGDEMKLDTALAQRRGYLARVDKSAKKADPEKEHSKQFPHYRKQTHNGEIVRVQSKLFNAHADANFPQ